MYGIDKDGSVKCRAESTPTPTPTPTPSPNSNGWVDISEDTAPFDVDCEYKWKIPSFRNTGEANTFMPTRVNAGGITADYSAGNYQSVNSNNKKSSTGDAGTFAAQTFRKCAGVSPYPASTVFQTITTTVANNTTNWRTTQYCPAGYKLVPDSFSINSMYVFNGGGAGPLPSNDGITCQWTFACGTMGRDFLRPCTFKATCYK